MYDLDEAKTRLFPQAMATPALHASGESHKLVEKLDRMRDERLLQHEAVKLVRQVAGHGASASPPPPAGAAEHLDRQGAVDLLLWLALGPHDADAGCRAIN